MEPITILFAASSVMLLAGGAIIDRKYNQYKTKHEEAIITINSMQDNFANEIHLATEYAKGIQDEVDNLRNTNVFNKTAYLQQVEKLTGMIEDLKTQVNDLQANNLLLEQEKQTAIMSQKLIASKIELMQKSLKEFCGE